MLKRKWILGLALMVMAAVSVLATLGHRLRKQNDSDDKRFS
jgi:hypothetical protein